MRKILAILALAIALSGCTTNPPPANNGTAWCNEAFGIELGMIISVSESDIHSVTVEGIKTVEGIPMCSMVLDFTDPETGERGTLKQYSTENIDYFLLETYNAEGKIQIKMKNTGEGTELTVYDDDGNPHNIDV